MGHQSAEVQKGVCTGVLRALYLQRYRNVYRVDGDLFQRPYGISEQYPAEYGFDRRADSVEHRPQLYHGGGYVHLPMDEYGYWISGIFGGSPERLQVLL